MKQLGVFLATLAIGGAALGMIRLYQTDQPAFWVWAVALVLIAIYLGATSIYIIRPDDMIASYFLGTYRITYVNRKYARIAKGMKGREWRLGHIGDYVLLPWLFRLLWQGIRIPTTAIKIPVMVSRVLTMRGKDVRGKDVPRVRLRLNSTMIFRLSPNVASVIETFELLEKGVYDLTETVPMKDNAGRTHRVPIIAEVIRDTAQETILEAVRVAASQYSYGGLRDIVSNKVELEQEIKRILAEKESVFAQASLLKLENGEGVEGDAALSVDFNIEEIAPDPIPKEGETSDFEKAIDRPMIAILEAEATVRKAEAEAEREYLIREGRAAGMKKIAEDLKAGDRMEVYRGEVVRDATSNTTFIAIPKEEGLTGSLAALMAAFFGPARPPRGGSSTE